MRIRDYVNHRGITDAVVDLHQLGWNGERITIPIFDRDGRLSFFKLAKDPADTKPGPKMISPPGTTAELYGWERVRTKPCRIVICEGEFDRLVLETHGLAAVTSTGGAGVFRTEWAEAFAGIPEVYVCFDRDEAGRKGALHVARIIPQAQIVELPEEVGVGGDVTDYFVRLGRTREDFLELLKTASSAGSEKPAERRSPQMPRAAREGDAEARRLKSLVRLEEVVAARVPLRPSGATLMGRCPFHDDRSPSFTVYPLTQTFHCFGCGAHGDVIEFLMRSEGLTFSEALRVIRDLAKEDGKAA